MVRIYEFKRVTIKPITFRGKHNRVKCKLFLFLELWGRARGTPLRALDIHEYCPGISIGYLHSRLYKLAKWRYLTNTVLAEGGRPCFGYKLGRRGRNVLELMPDELYGELMGELMAECKYLMLLIANKYQPQYR